MIALLITTFNQASTFLPLALALYVSFCILHAIDMSLDGSFVLGAAIFARLLELNASPIIAAISAILGGAIVGLGVSTMQRGQKIDSLLAGVLATFILLSGNLLIMGRPNISLLTKTTLVSGAFQHSQTSGWMLVAVLSSSFCLLTCIILLTRFGLILRAFGDNPNLLQRMGKPIEVYRLFGFALTNGLAAVSGCLTAQTIGYADIGMSYGMTLTALGTVILGKQILDTLLSLNKFNIAIEFTACLIGVLFYFFAINGLLRLEINPLYLKMLLGLVLIIFLRLAHATKTRGLA
jgi:putative ABC transport system permease protein